MAIRKKGGKKFLRITISENKHNEIKRKAQDLDLSITSYVKTKIFGENNGN